MSGMPENCSAAGGGGKPYYLYKETYPQKKEFCIWNQVFLVNFHHFRISSES